MAPRLVFVLAVLAGCGDISAAGGDPDGGAGAAGAMSAAGTGGTDTTGAAGAGGAAGSVVTPMCGNYGYDDIINQVGLRISSTASHASCTEECAALLGRTETIDTPSGQIATSQTPGSDGLCTVHVNENGMVGNCLCLRVIELKLPPKG